MKHLLTSVTVFSIPLLLKANHIVPQCQDDRCDFCDLVQLGWNIVHFFAWIVVPLSAIAFAWAGFLYLSSGGSQDKISRAHSIFKKVAIGLILALGAYLIIHMIIVGLTRYDSIEGMVGCPNIEKWTPFGGGGTGNGEPVSSHQYWFCTPGYANCAFEERPEPCPDPPPSGYFCDAIICVANTDCTTAM